MGLTTGSVRYTDDQQIPALFGYPVLSEVATGKLEHLEWRSEDDENGIVQSTSPARTALDSFQEKSQSSLRLARRSVIGEKIMTSGQQLALVVADSYRTAKRGAGAVQVKIANANEDAIITLDQAIAAESYLDEAWRCALCPACGHEMPAHFRNTVDKGDLEEGFKASDLVFEGTTYVIGQHAFPLEKQTALAVPEEKKGMTVWHSTQGHDFTRAKLAGVLGVPGSSVVCKQSRAGGAFGPKNSRQVPTAAMAAVAAHKLDKAVRVAYEATLEQLAVGGRHSFKTQYKAVRHVDRVDVRANRSLARADVLGRLV
eukprot:g32794.t1